MVGMEEIAKQYAADVARITEEVLMMIAGVSPDEEYENLSLIHI